MILQHFPYRSSLTFEKDQVLWTNIRTLVKMGKLIPTIHSHKVSYIACLVTRHILMQHKDESNKCVRLLVQIFWVQVEAVEISGL
jgi:hypothetical protein